MDEVIAEIIDVTTVTRCRRVTMSLSAMSGRGQHQPPNLEPVGHDYGRFGTPPARLPYVEPKVPLRRKAA